MALVRIAVASGDRLLLLLFFYFFNDFVPKSSVRVVWIVFVDVVSIFEFVEIVL
jgi:hypothetical protein